MRNHSIWTFHQVLAGVMCLAAILAAGAALAQEEWKVLSGEALWDQAGRYEDMRLWRETCDALDKYLGGGVGSAGFSPSPGGAALSPERLAEARFRLACAEFQAARSTKDFGRFDTLLADFETSHTAETARIQTLRQLWTEAPLTKDDWTEGERRLRWYLATYPDAPEAVLVKKDLARKKWQDGDQDGAVADLRAILAGNAGSTLLAPVAGALGDCECERGEYEAQAAALEGFLKDHAEDYPGLALLHLALGMAYLNLGRSAEVGAQMAYVIEHDFYGGHAHEAVRASAQALDKMGLARDGLAYLEEVVRRYADTMPRFEFVIHERADFQLRLDGPDAAIASLKAHITSHPALVTVGDAVYVLSRVVMKAQGPAAAIAEMEGLAAAYGLYAGRRAQHLLTELCACNEDPASAVKYCREFVEKYPDSPVLESVLNMECFYLYRARRFEEAEKAAEARLQASNTRTNRDVVPLYVLSIALLQKSRDLEAKGQVEEANQARSSAREVRDIYMSVAGEEDINYTVTLYLAWRDEVKAQEIASRYLETHPEGGVDRDWLLANLASSQLGDDPVARAPEKAAKILDEMRAVQRSLSANSLAAVSRYDPRIWPRVLKMRIFLAAEQEDWGTVRECLVELRDKVPPMMDRTRVMMNVRKYYTRLNEPFPPDAK
jgi:tetratricopeptide (TPR) repeat protein